MKQLTIPAATALLTLPTIGACTLPGTLDQTASPGLLLICNTLLAALSLWLWYKNRTPPTQPPASPPIEPETIIRIRDNAPPELRGRIGQIRMRLNDCYIVEVYETPDEPTSHTLTRDQIQAADIYAQTDPHFPRDPQPKAPAAPPDEPLTPAEAKAIAAYQQALDDPK